MKEIDNEITTQLEGISKKIIEDNKPIKNKTLTKHDDKYDKKEAKQVSQYIEEIIEIIKNVDIENDCLNIYFKKCLSKFNEIK